MWEFYLFQDATLSSTLLQLQASILWKFPQGTFKVEQLNNLKTMLKFKGKKKGGGLLKF